MRECQFSFQVAYDKKNNHPKSTGTDLMKLSVTHTDLCQSLPSSISDDGLENKAHGKPQAEIKGNKSPVKQSVDRLDRK